MTLTPSEIVLIFLVSKPIFILGAFILIGVGAKTAPARAPQPKLLEHDAHPKMLTE